jgi:hypothetical protein
MESDSLQARIQHSIAELRGAYPRITVCHATLEHWHEGSKARWALQLDIRWMQHQSLISGPARRSDREAVRAAFDLATHSLGGPMLSLQDCLALCELTEEQVLAIAHHQRLPEIAAAELGHYLVRTPQGRMRVKSMIRDDLVEARVRGDGVRELALKLVLRDFVLQHPHCEERKTKRLVPDLTFMEV